MLSRAQTETLARLYGPILDLLNSRYLTPMQLASRWKWTDQHLANLRRAGKGPAFIRLSRSVRYPLSEILAWELAGQSTHVTPDRIGLAVATLTDLPAEKRDKIAAILSEIISPSLPSADGVIRRVHI